MKRLLSFILAFTLILGLVACGKSAKLPDGFDQALYDYAEAAYELVHDYNLGKIDKAVARERADTIMKNVDALKVPKNNTNLSDDTFKLTYETNQLTIAIQLQAFCLNTATGSSCVEVENSLKKLIEQ